MKQGKNTSVKWKMVSMILLYWALPFVLMLALVGHIMADRQEKTGLERLAAQLEMYNQNSIERIDSAISDSRQATYDKTLYGYYDEFRKGSVNFDTVYNKGQYYMAKQYGKRKEISSSVFMLLRAPKVYKMTNYNTPAGGSYNQLKTFWEKDCDDVLEFAKSLDTSIGIYQADGRLYLVRNLVDSVTYHPWGVLVHRLNLNYCFESLLHFYDNTNVKIVLDGKNIVTQGNAEIWKDAPEAEKKGPAVYTVKDKKAYICHMVKGSDFILSTVIEADTKELFNPLYDYRYLLLLMTLFLLPMLGLFWWMSTRYLTDPLKLMVGQAKEIESGNLGYQLEKDTKSLEFEYLRESYNHMSRTLKYQFDHIYEEELALRDARIMALQSHINPHFMNNTLEIINWEARLGENEKVSRMIEALSVLMNAAMDRKKLPEITLSEEMIYVDAYLYITSERLGKRFHVVKEMDENTMKCMVPRLIMQPVIENAVKHGVIPRGEGTVTIRSYLEKDYLLLEVKNDGEISEEDQKKISRLLAPDYDTSKETSLNLGIANVNQRLRILYGDQCGLTIKEVSEGCVISRICIATETSEK